MIIVDVGAHDGQTFSLPMAKEGNNIVYAIEPIPELAEILRRKSLTNLLVYPIALGSENCNATLHINRGLETSSLLTADCTEDWQNYAEQLQEISSISVEVMRLDSFMEQNGITEIDILKIDAQGFDLQVLEGAGKRLSAIKRIQLEVQISPLYVGSSSKDEVVSFLAERGFRLNNAIPQTDGLEENLEFIRIHRFPTPNSDKNTFTVDVPEVGLFETPAHDHVGYLLEQGVFEVSEQAFLWLYLHPGDIFVDCGAHVGLFSCIAAHAMQHRGQVIGFEPNPNCMQLYRQNMAHLSSCEFRGMELGLSDHQGTAKLLLGKPGMSAFSTFASGSISASEISEHHVEATVSTLDQALEELSIDTGISLVKIDVEGWESNLLRGADNNVKAGNLPVLMVEFTEANAIAAGNSTAQLRQQLEALGYQLCRFDITRLCLVNEPHRQVYPYDNLFAVQDRDDVNQRLESAAAERLAIAHRLIVQRDLAIHATQAEAEIIRQRRQVYNLSQLHQKSEQELQATVSQLEAVQSDNLLAKQQIVHLQQAQDAIVQQTKQTSTSLEAKEEEFKQLQSHLEETFQNINIERQQHHQQLEQQQQQITYLQEEKESLAQRSEQAQAFLDEKDQEFHRLQCHLEETFHNVSIEREQHQSELEAQQHQHQVKLEAQQHQHQVELEDKQATIHELQRHLDETFRNIEVERFNFHQQHEALRQGIGISIPYFALKKAQRLVSKIVGRPINKATLKSVPGKIKHKLRLPALKRRLLNLKTQVQDQVVSSPHEELLALSGIGPQNFLEGVAPLCPPHQAASTDPPTISILTPTWNSSLDWFLETAISVLSQTYDRWEWCIVDDGSRDQELRNLLQRFSELHPQVKVVLADSGGISAATNQAMAIASGEYICFLDHDDTLTPNALATLVAKLNKGFDIVYSDEDKIDFSGKRYVEPFHKPGWSPEYLRGVMYVGHLLGVRKHLAESVGGVRSAFDGVQDYDLMLRLSEQTNKIGHIPQILYHWRKIPGSISGDVNAKSVKIERLQRDAVNEHLQRLNLPAQAEPMGFHRLKIVPNTSRNSNPLVSIIIPTKDAPDYLDRCLTSLFNISSYPNIEVVLVDNETTDDRALEIMATHEASHNLKRVPLANPFNYSRANNVGVAASKGQYLVFLNNDTEVIAADWLENMIYYAEQAHIGAVGSLLLFPDHTVQHAGVVMGFRGTADHVMRDFPADGDGYAGSLCCAREVSAVTAACLMMKRSDFEQIGGFSEHFFTHYQDVDLCLKLVAEGKTNIFTPRAILTHYESKTRKAYYDWGDRLLLLDQFQDYIDVGDRYYNPNFDLSKHDYSLKG